MTERFTRGVGIGLLDVGTTLTVLYVVGTQGWGLLGYGLDLFWDQAFTGLNGTMSA